MGQSRRKKWQKSGREKMIREKWKRKNSRKKIAQEK
jgi:hypothetical protein